MEGEIGNLLKVWSCVFTSLFYCYIVGKIFLRGGILRLIFIVPIIFIFLLLPLNLSSVHLAAITGFFISWLGTFKLVLFSLGQGPLAQKSISIRRFIAISCLPIKIRDEKSSQNSKKELQLGAISKCVLNHGTIGLLLVLIVKAYEHADRIHPKLRYLLYYFHIYFTLEIVFALITTSVRVVLKMELEPHFNMPYLSTSIQDFWGNRWNLMVTSILRATVYNPIRIWVGPLLGHRWASSIAMIGTFTVSGLMHELIYYYMGRVPPTWEVTCFFVLQGFCLMGEVAIKRWLLTNGILWRLPRVVSSSLTIGFMISTGYWLFFPQVLRCKADIRALEELMALKSFIRSYWVFPINPPNV